VRHSAHGFHQITKHKKLGRAVKTVETAILLSVIPFLRLGDHRSYVKVVAATSTLQSDSRPSSESILRMDVVRSIALFLVAAVAEIGGAWMVWQGVREHRGLLWIGAGIGALGIYGFVATFQPDAHFGRILAAYGGVFVAGSLAWGVVMDGFRPDRFDIIGAVICLLGVAVIMYSPRAT
jgi:small multidrug resistance family-3 protein